MRYRWIQVLAVWTGFILPGINLNAQQSDAKHLIGEGDRLAWLKNWQAAEPFFAKAEPLFREAGDRRNELYAQIGRIRGELQKRGLFETSTFLDSLLDDPLLKNDAQLRLRCLTVKGDVDMDFDTDLAERDWTEALSIAKTDGDSPWINRANGELGLISFLHGDYSTGALRVMGALSQAQKLKDVGGQIRYLTLIGDGLLQIGRYDQAVAMFDQAIAVGRGNPDLGEPAMAYAGKAQALGALGKNSEAKELLESLLETSRDKSAFGYESQALLELGKLEERQGQGPAAIGRLKQAVAEAKKVDGYNLVSEADLELSKALLKERRYTEAETAAREGLEASRNIGDKLLVPRSLTQLALVKESQGGYRTADSLFGEASEIVDAMLATTPNQYAKSSLASSMDSVFLGHFELAATHLNDARQGVHDHRRRPRAVNHRHSTRPPRESRTGARLNDENGEGDLKDRAAYSQSWSGREKEAHNGSAEFRAASRSDGSARRSSTPPSADATDSDHAFAEGVGRGRGNSGIRSHGTGLVLPGHQPRACRGFQAGEPCSNWEASGSGAGGPSKGWPLGRAGGSALCKGDSADGKRRVCKDQIDRYPRRSAVFAAIRGYRTTGGPASTSVSCHHVRSIRNCIYASG